MHPERLATWLTALCLSCALCASASAQPAQPVSAKVDPRASAPIRTNAPGAETGGKHALARSLTREAMNAYRAGHYALALDRFQAAYARVPAPELLFNVGQCYRQLRRDEAAKAVFEAYLRALPDAPERAQIERWIASREGQHAITPAAAALAPPARSQSDVDRPLFARPTRASERDDEPELYERWWFWTAVCAVAVGGGVTAAYLIESNNAGETPAAGSLGTVRWN